MTRIRGSIVLLILATMISLLVSCGTSKEIVYARATKLPVEVNGFMRVATEEPVLVDVAGTDHADERSIAGYIVIHEQDLAQLIRNTEELLAVKKGK